MMRDLERSWALKGWTPTPLELERLTKVISNLTSPLNIGPTRTEEFKMASLPKIGFSNRYSSVFFSSEQRASVRCHFFFFRSRRPFICLSSKRNSSSPSSKEQMKKICYVFDLRTDLLSKFIKILLEINPWTVWTLKSTHMGQNRVGFETESSNTMFFIFGLTQTKKHDKNWNDQLIPIVLGLCNIYILFHPKKKIAD